MAGSLIATTSRPPSVSRAQRARVLLSRNSIFETNVACGQPNKPASICPTWFESSSTACLPIITTCGLSLSTSARRMRATAYGSSARESSMRMARSMPIASAARICSSTVGAPIVTPTISVASARSRIRNASSMAISSNGLITDLGVETAPPATVASLGSGTLLNGTRTFIDPPRITLQSQQRGDDVALDLARARVELAADRVAQFPLDLVLGHVPVAAVDLDRVLAAFDPAVADVELGHRGLQVNALAVAAQPRAIVEHVPGALDPQLHVD